MAKKRVNWTISRECISLIKSALEISKNSTKSSIVEYCIHYTIGNKREHLIQKQKQLLTELAEIDHKIRELDIFNKKDIEQEDDF